MVHADAIIDQHATPLAVGGCRQTFLSVIGAPQCDVLQLMQRLATVAVLNRFSERTGNLQNLRDYSTLREIFSSEHQGNRYLCLILEGLLSRFLADGSGVATDFRVGGGGSES